MHLSDNGFFLGEWSFRATLHARAIDSRAVSLKLPKTRVQPGRPEATQMVLNIDIAPTVLDIAGVKAPASMHGMSVVR